LLAFGKRGTSPEEQNLSVCASRIYGHGRAPHLENREMRGTHGS